MRCQTTTTRLTVKGYPNWYRTKDKLGYICQKCYDHLRRFKNERALIQQRICSNCGSNRTVVTAPVNGRHFPHHRWYKDHKGGFWCNSCYHKIMDDPAKVRARNKRRMWFKNQVVHLKENPRKGICSLCGRTDLKTDMHHIQYHDRKPLKDAIEVCASCHMKESMKTHGVKSLRWG
jgi:hypothetical protein